MGVLSGVPAQAQICFGKVMHHRLRPVRHHFIYGVFFLRMPLSAIASLGNACLHLDRFGLISFMRRDHGPCDGSDLEGWMRRLLANEGLTRADGEIVLQAFPRVLGYVFNPISIWYCHDRDGALRTVLCEVRNTFGERHNYLVSHPDERPIVAGDWMTARKAFHVSPFCEVKGHYRFRFRVSGSEVVAQIDYHDGDKPADKILVTTVQGCGRPVTAARVLYAFFRYPLMTIGVIVRIHWQALKLWIKRVPFVAKPAPPLNEISR